MRGNRHRKIIELVDNYEIETQEDLADRLRAEGFQVTQATVSRDIRALKLSKVSVGSGKQKYVALKGDDTHLNAKYTRVLKDGFISMDKAQNILVIKTVAGMAMAVAAAVDAMDMKEIVGSIAGDDTIMAAVRSADDVDVVMEQIAQIIN